MIVVLINKNDGKRKNERSSRTEIFKNSRHMSIESWN